jgi:two-component system response regulator (stage 0 sporulation protein F)
MTNVSIMETKRLLIVEDDPEMVEVYEENLPGPEFQTRSANNGLEALEILRNTSEGFEWLILDNEMPKMDGIALLRKVRQDFPKLKVVIVTGYGNWRDYVDAYNLGVIKFLDKPIRMEELRKLVRSEGN